MKTECDYLCGWTKKMVTGKISSKVVNRRDTAGNAGEEVCNVKLRWKSQIKFAIKVNHTILTPGQPVLALTLYHLAR